MTRRTKTVCTLGPATASPEAVAALVAAGMDVARLNFSHGTQEQHEEAYGRVRTASNAAQRGVAVLADLQGPKFRLGTFAGANAFLNDGASFVLTAEACNGSALRATTSYAQLAHDVAAGDTLLIDDGMVRLEVVEADSSDIRCRVVQGGIVSDHKGINLPGVRVNLPALTSKDIDDLRFALRLGVDMVALSFVRGPDDADVVRAIMDETGRRVPVIAKLERPEAIDRLEEVVDAFDGVMVARGDLGVEIAPEHVPLAQKRIVQLARRRAKPVIVATQMLESMIQQPRPTRAETSDVANAVFDGADALMLSGETSIGRHPIEAVETMCRIIGAAEAGDAELAALPEQAWSRQDAVVAAAIKVTRALPVRALVAFTQTGATARRLASHRSPVPLLAFTPEPAVRSQLSLVWGVETFVVDPVAHTDDMVAQVEQALLGLQRAQRGDVVVIVAGTPLTTAGSTNMLRVHRLGEGG